MKKKKSKDNPFKLWGSWVAASFPILILLNSATFKCSGNLFFGTSCSRDFSVFFSNLASLFVPNPSSGQTIGITVVFWVVFLLVVAICFVAGWGVHSLVKSFKR